MARSRQGGRLHAAAAVLTMAVALTASSPAPALDGPLRDPEAGPHLFLPPARSDALRRTPFGLSGPAGPDTGSPGEGGQAHSASTPPPSPADKAEALRKALAPRPPLSVLRRRSLDALYAKLAASGDADEAKGLATLIADVWMRSGSDTADLLMQRAVAALGANDLPLAQSVLDGLVTLDPGWAEAWNKRATVRFLAGDPDGSMADIDHVLKLEPRHFGALDGMAMILQRTGFDKRALTVYRRALAVYPHQPDVEKIVEKLTVEVEGQGI